VSPHKVSVRDSTYKLLKEEAEKRGLTISELIDEAVRWFIHGHHPPHNSTTIKDFNWTPSEIEDIKQDLEKIKQFLTRKFGMEFFTSR